MRVHLPQAKILECVIIIRLREDNKMDAPLLAGIGEGIGRVITASAKAIDTVFPGEAIASKQRAARKESGKVLPYGKRSIPRTYLNI